MSANSPTLGGTVASYGCITHEDHLPMAKGCRWDSPFVKVCLLVATTISTFIVVYIHTTTASRSTVLSQLPRPARPNFGPTKRKDASPLMNSLGISTVVDSIAFTAVQALTPATAHTNLRLKKVPSKIAPKMNAKPPPKLAPSAPLTTHLQTIASSAQHAASMAGRAAAMAGHAASMAGHAAHIKGSTGFPFEREPKVKVVQAANAVGDGVNGAAAAILQTTTMLGGDGGDPPPRKRQ